MPNKQAAATQNNQNRMSGQAMSRREISPATDMVDYLQQYARERPEVVAMWCFGAGFVLGWKLKFW